MAQNSPPVTSAIASDFRSAFQAQNIEPRAVRMPIDVLGRTKHAAAESLRSAMLLANVAALPLVSLPLYNIEYVTFLALGPAGATPREVGARGARNRCASALVVMPVTANVCVCVQQERPTVQAPNTSCVYM